MYKILKYTNKSDVKVILSGARSKKKTHLIITDSLPLIYIICVHHPKMDIRSLAQPF